METMKQPGVKQLVRNLINRYPREVTLLAVCPNSRAVARAALLAAKETGAPMLFAATLNQVDLDGGYTGWTPAELVAFLRRESMGIGLETPVYPCLDHGGPWLKDAHTNAKLSYDQTMQAVKQSLEACIDAGYALLHIDPTVDRTLPEAEGIPIEWVIDRTLDLIEHAEAYRHSNGRRPISYEVGTEEVHGGLANLSNFDAFLKGLDTGLRERGLPEARPAFVVGKVGTDLDTSLFDPGVARRLTERVTPFGALLKGHYTDYVENPEDYPRSGMGGANVGPEFADIEYRALAHLSRIEKEKGADSGLGEALRNAVVDSGRWKKWLHEDERGASFDELSEERCSWLLGTCSRYIWTDPRVEEARRHLYRNVEREIDADAYVVGRITDAIVRYVESFNLVGFAEKLAASCNA